MERLSRMLSYRVVMVAIVLGFVGLCIGCAIGASKLTQEFRLSGLVPRDSYFADYWDSYRPLAQQSGIGAQVYFRFVDQSDPAIQQQMEDFINDLVIQTDGLLVQPPHFWVRDFHLFVNTSMTEVQSLPFRNQLDAFLAVSSNKLSYEKNILRNEQGDIVASRTWISMEGVDLGSVQDQVNSFEAVNAVCASQPINHDRKDWAFFTHDNVYFFWEFYLVVEDEIAFVAIVGIVAVSVLSFLFIPHWTAVFFVAPLISMLYVDLLGVLKFANQYINLIAYISLLMSIGLLVDFLMHVLSRFYESKAIGREAKAKETLRTIGSSVLVGGLSTFLGVLPLVFSTSSIFHILLISFLGLVTLGAGHGLILLPVLLSLFGPDRTGVEDEQEVAVVQEKKKEEESEQPNERTDFR